MAGTVNLAFSIVDIAIGQDCPDHPANTCGWTGTLLLNGKPCGVVGGCVYTNRDP